MAAGLLVIAANIWTFAAIGQGTLAPWDPPRELVVRGLYAHVCNPMILGVLITLAGEAVALRSWRLAAWAGLFFAGNTAHFIFIEEPGLEKRFGAAYVEYKRTVPRWLPRLKTWKPREMEGWRDGGEMNFEPMEKNELSDFLTRWLAAWTGNDPAGLLEFYASDAFYTDPAFRGGLQGHDSLRRYFTKLLAANPAWEWKLLEMLPTEKGCAVKWLARIPTPGGMVEEEGLDIVEIRDGKITRNEIFFDRSRLLLALGRTPGI